ncbi:hypothetical protein MHU86_4592 [Fragilaria crotonensis]|nr:hypothetical protein MHU86_4592 [Fragilaria crotonensis]
MEEDGLAKLLFWRLDPSLRLLAAITERYVQLEEDGENQHNIGEKYAQDVFGKHQSTREEKLIGLLKIQVQLLDSLRNELHHLVSKPKDGVALGFIATYVMVPLQAILNCYNKRSVHLSRQSQVWKSQQGAATVLTQVLRLCPQRPFIKPKTAAAHDLCCGGHNANKRIDTLERAAVSSRRLDREKRT